MRKFNRDKSPDFLVDKWEDWGQRYKSRREITPGVAFQWPTHNGERIYLPLVTELRKQTQDHCSYCDGYYYSNYESAIDHFKPKGVDEFFHLVCQWENLYYSCSNCNGFKKEYYSEELLRPDDKDYDFNTFFIYNYIKHEIDPNPYANDYQKARAKLTIKTFGLNEFRNTHRRKKSFEEYERKKNMLEKFDLNDFSHRFILEI